MALPRLEAPAKGQKGPRASDRLLIVDNDPDFTAFFAAVARSAGYEAMEINDSTRFEGALRSWQPSHVVVDLNMPTIDGVEALQMLVQHRSAAKIVLCSGATRDFLDSVNRLGGRFGLTMSGVLQKPLRPTALKEFLERIATESEPPTSLDDAFDSAFFDEVCATMGRDWVVKGLRKLAAQIETTFGQESLAPADRRQLAQRAHALASSAGMFGFSELSQLCRRLEDACSKEEDLLRPLHQAQSASRPAGNRARELIIELEQ